MASLPTRSKDNLVTIIAAAMQGRVERFLNFATGSVLLAFTEAKAGVALWLQAEVLRVLKTSRAATSDDEDLDTFVGDFEQVRLPATSASGIVTFGRYTSAPVTIRVPVGSVVQTNDGTQQFQVYADSSRENYSADFQAYLIGPGEASVDVPVSSTTPGPDSNVGARAIQLVSSSISGVDYVFNANPLSGGAAKERDEDLRTRFQLFFDSLSKATDTAIIKAVRDLGVGVTCKILRRDPNLGQPYVTVVVDDGSGSPPDTLVQRAAQAVLDTRACGVWVPVIGASTVRANVTLQIDVEPGYYKPDVVAAVEVALSKFISGLKLGTPLRYSRIEHEAYAASAGVSNVLGVTLNGDDLDLIPTLAQTIKPGNIVVS